MQITYGSADGRYVTLGIDGQEFYFDTQADLDEVDAMLARLSRLATTARLVADRLDSLTRQRRYQRDHAPRRRPR